MATKMFYHIFPLKTMKSQIVTPETVTFLRLKNTSKNIKSNCHANTTTTTKTCPEVTSLRVF